MKHTRASRAFFALTLLLVPLTALGDQHFYRSGPYYSEPRFSLDRMTGIDVMVMGGSTSNGRDASGNKVGTLGIYGNHNMHKLGEGVPNLDPVNFPTDGILLNLTQQASNGNFGQLQFAGKFSYVGGEVSLTQNLWYGFFSQLVVPWGQRKVSDIAFTDLSPNTGLPNINSVEWIQFLATFDAMLATYNLSKGAISETSLGDVESYVGWAYNCDSCEFVDFFDTTIRVGGSFYTSKPQNINNVFSVPQGYDGHNAFIGTFDMAFGAFEWFTAGFHVGGKVFNTRDVIMGLKTSANQNGFIKLAQGRVTRKLGNIWDIGTFVKADHVFSGFSLIFGYTYQAQEATTLTSKPLSTDTAAIFSDSVINGDGALQKWNMHELFVSADYDFAKEGRWFNPHLTFFYSVPVAGKRIFNTQMFGGVAGANITWNF